MINKQSIYLIIVLMSVSMIGLIIIQFNWTNQAVVLQKSRFEQTVYQAMQSVSKKYEIIDAVQSLQRSKTIDYRKDLLSKFEKTGLKNSDEVFEFEKDEAQDLEYFRTNWSCIKPDEYLNDNQVMAIIDVVTEKNDIANKLALDLLFDQKPIEERIDRVVLDTLIKGELKLRGITTNYDYVVRIPNSNRLVALSNKAGIQNLIKTPFKSKLFNSSALSNGAELMLYFPNQQKYLLSKMWLMLGSSLAFILVTLGCFAFVIMIIFRQKQLSEMKTDFINNMTHELKTPISTISLASEMIRAQMSNSGNQSVLKYSNIIFDENKRLGSQVDRVLQMAVIDKGEMKLKKDELDLHEIIEKATENLLLKVAEKDGTLDTDLEADNSGFLGDKVHITNIIHNLLDNAFKYSKEVPEINVGTKNVKNGIEISIADKGIGMSKDAVAKIFDKFYRVSTGDIHDVKGFGLGLSYVKKIVEAHEGDVKVKSKKDIGSEFIIFLPQ